MGKIISLLLILSTCTAITQDTSITRYMPLAVGNVWVYQCGASGTFCLCSKRMKLKISNSVMKNGKTYFVVQYSEYTSLCGPPGSCSSLLGSDTIRIDAVSGNIFRYRPIGCSYTTGEEMIDSLRAGLNDTIKYCGVINGTLCRDTSSVVVFGISIPSRSFGVLFVDSGSGRRYGRGFGMVSLSSFGASCSSNTTLVGCVVNGTFYGDTTFLVGVNVLNTEIPEKYELLQNYPNPFNPTTNFGFRIADFGLVRLTVFDALGGEVTSLVNQQLNPGTYEVSWDASVYPSGVYYYRLESGSFTQTRKMVLIK